MLAAAAAAILSGRAWPAAWVGAVALSWFAWSQRDQLPQGLGTANGLTALRLLGTVALANLALDTQASAAAVLTLAILALDGLDGWIARRLDQVSEFGARFDMECDALLVLVGSLVLYLQHRLGPFVLLAGALRYLYVLALPYFPLASEAPRSRLARYVFGVVVLSFGASFAAWPWHRELAFVAVALLCYSFGRSVYFSFQAARA
jgi:phosphatidylglycerophosphate synthase